MSRWNLDANDEEEAFSIDMYVRATCMSRKVAATGNMRLITLSFRIDMLDGAESWVAPASPILQDYGNAKNNN